MSELSEHSVSLSSSSFSWAWVLTRLALTAFSLFFHCLRLYSCAMSLFLVACEITPKITSQNKLWWKNSHAFKVKEDMSMETEPKPFQMKPSALATGCWCRGWCSHHNWSVSIHAIRILELCYRLMCLVGEFFTTGSCCCLRQQQCYIDMYISDIHSIIRIVFYICKIYI